MPTEIDLTSDNETFADCTDDRDPLASTFAETASFNLTTDADSYQSAFNNTLSSNFNHSMDNIADITLEAGGGESSANKQEPEGDSRSVHTADEEEPMDIDMNATMEMLQNSSNNIQHVEKVLQHAENILHHLEDQKPLKDVHNENSLLQKETVFVKNVLTENQADQGKEKDKEMSFNRNYNLPLTETKAECHIESNDLDKSQKENIVPHENVSKDVMNLSSNSNSSLKLTANSNTSKGNLNSTLNLSASPKSQQNSAPSSPTFPMKTTPSAGFPRSPKALSEKQAKSPFLEKSDFLLNLENQVASVMPSLNISNGSEETEPITTNEISNVVLESTNMTDDTIKCQTFAVINSPEETKENNENNAAGLRNKLQTFSVDTLDNEQNVSIEKRRTFNVNTNESVANKLTKFPSMEKPEIKRLTFNASHTPDDGNESNENLLNATKIDTKPRYTFNVSKEESKQADVSTEQTDLNKSLEPMEIDVSTISQNTTIPLSENTEQEPQTLSSTDIKEKSPSPPIPNRRPSPSTTECRSQSPPLPAMQSKIQSTPPAIEDNNTEVNTADFLNQDLAANNQEEHISPSSAFELTASNFACKPLSTLIQKRPPIRDARARAADILSAKEQSNIKAKDEKDVLVEKTTPSPTEEGRAIMSATSNTFTNSSRFDQSSSSYSSADNNAEQPTELPSMDNEFTGNNRK